MDKITLLAKRQEFFEEIMKHLNSPPSKIDQLLNQDKYFIYPDMNNSFLNPEYGDMIIQINGKFYDKDFNIFYSFWQLGDTLKIGIAIGDIDLQGAFASDAHNEIYYIWGTKNDPRIDVARGCVFYDWEFEVPDLYDNYRNEERFILGAKHMHFRVMRILYDECERIYYNEHNKESENSEIDISFDSIPKDI